MSDRNLNAYNIADLRELARRKLPHGMFEFLDRGTEDEVSLHNNRAALERIRFKPNTLVDVSKRSQATTLFGKPLSMPVLIAPTGFAGLCAYQGEVLLAKAAAAAGVPYILGAHSLTAMETVVELGGGTPWFQLYMWPDRKLSHALTERARAVGFETLVITTDGAVEGNREHNMRNGFFTPFTLTRRNVTDVLAHPRWVAEVLLQYLMREGMPRKANLPAELQSKVTADPSAARAHIKTDSICWDDLRAFRKMWPGTLIVKGILNRRDALLAADCGVEGIVLSNHGGRNLDGAIAPVEALPEIVEAVGSRVTIMVDSGFRRGSDVVKALALGAKAVLLGRAPLYGLAAAGEAGVALALEIFREEIKRVLGQLGCNSIAELNSGLLCMRDARSGRNGRVA